MANPTLPPFEEALAEFHAKGDFLMLAGRTAGSAEELWQIYTQSGVEVDRDLLPKEQVTIDRIALLEKQVADAAALLQESEAKVLALQAQVDEMTVTEPKEK